MKKLLVLLLSTSLVVGCLLIPESEIETVRLTPIECDDTQPELRTINCFTLKNVEPAPAHLDVIYDMNVCRVHLGDGWRMVTREESLKMIGLDEAIFVRHLGRIRVASLYYNAIQQIGETWGHVDHGQGDLHKENPVIRCTRD